MDLTYFINHMPDKIRRCAVQRLFTPGEAVTRQSEPVSYIYLLTVGTTRVFTEFESGQRYTFARNKGPILLGELEVLSHQAIYATTNEAITNCIVYAFTPKAFYDWMRADIDFAIYVAEHIATKMYPTSMENGRIKFQPSTLRLENYLLRMMGDIDTNCFLLHTTRQQIADAIGTSTKTVNRSVDKLKQDGRISLTRGKIQINREQRQRLIQDLKNYYGQ